MRNTKILTFTGASGVGKTSIVAGILEKRPELRLVLSYTTRSSRSSDLPGEYAYLNREEFEAVEKSGRFLWLAEMAGEKYGTLSESVEAALAAEYQSVMILVPERVETLARYIPGRIKSFYILSPPEEILRARLERRGEKSELIDRRLIRCREWDREAGRSPIPYIFVTNDGKIEEAVARVLALLPGSCS